MHGFYRRFIHPYARTPVTAVAFGFLFILGSIALGSHSLVAFFSVEGLVIVVGGVLAVVCMSYDGEDVRKALAAIATLVKEPNGPPPERLHEDMIEIIGWAATIKKAGLRQLEVSLAQRGIDDPFIKYGLNMVLSGYAAEDVRGMMETAAEATEDRDSVAVDVLQTMTSHAPAFGMIGTLVGMVAMLCNLAENASGIGASLSVSFLATLYGVVSARMVYMPAAARLRQRVAQQRFRNQLVVEGMVMLLSDKPTMYIQDRLNSFLRPERRDYLDSFTAAGKGAAATPPAPRFKVIGA